MLQEATSRSGAPWWAWLVCVAVSLVGAFALLNAVVSLLFASVGGLPYGPSPFWYVPALVLGAVASVVIPVLVCRLLLRSWRSVAVVVAVVVGVALVLLGLTALG